MVQGQRSDSKDFLCQMALLVLKSYEGMRVCDYDEI